MAALFAAARDPPGIDALVSRDGSFPYSPGTVLEAGDVYPDRIAIPLLVLSLTEETLETWDAMRQGEDQGGIAPSVLNEWTHGTFYTSGCSLFRTCNSTLCTSAAIGWE